MSKAITASCRRLLVGIAGLAFSLSAFDAQAQQPAPLKLGVLTDMSSLYADITGPGSVAAAKMAVEDCLAGPHRMKRSIEVVSGDHMNKADVGASLAREWIDRDGVDAIVDTPNSAVALAVRNVVQQNNRVLLVSGASSSDLTGKSCSPNLVHWTYDTYALATGVARAVVESGGKTWFTLTADYAFGYAMEQDIKNVVQKAGGSVVGGVRTPINSQDLPCLARERSAPTAGSCTICTCLRSRSPTSRNIPGITTNSSR
jgi:branched-chain amino acid transport system substrate-binding protein